MVNVMEHTKYCGGVGYVMPSYDAAVVKERVGKDAIELLMRAARLNESAQGQQRADQLQRAFQQPLTFAQQAVIALARPFLAAAAILQNLQKLPLPVPGFVAQAGQLVGNQLAQATSMIVSFFFGNTKETDKEEAREKAEDNEVAQSDLFTKFVVSETNTSMSGGGR